MGKFIDLTGTILGDWKVNKYEGKGMWKCTNIKTNETKNLHSYVLRTKFGGKEIKNRQSSIEKGQRFGLWTTEEYLGGLNRLWKCTCDCGNTANIKEYDLLHNKSTKCNNPLHKNKQDLTGKVFGQWKVISYAGNMRWNCVCSCGKSRDILTKDLISGASKSCGHDRDYHIVRKDITGKIYGNLEVLRYTGKDNLWECKCLACGAIKHINRYSLVSGKTKSCGCLKEKIRVETMFNRYGDTNTTRINNPREDWQIDIISSKDNFEDFLVTEGKDKSLTEIAEILGITEPSLIRAIVRFDAVRLVKPTSSGESEIEKSLINYIKSIYNGKIDIHNRTVLNGKELDIYFPDINIAIEFNGTYWHSSEYKEITYHQNKTLECMKKHIRLIHIFEYEWANKEKREILKQFLRDLFLDSKVYYGRNTIIKDIDGRTAIEFLNRYHLQGYASSSINIGCFINEELIGVMSFGKPRYSSEYEYELIRLCWKCGIKVLGGANKLFKYFVKHYNPKSIISYCDIAKFSGRVYRSIGFETREAFITKPNYVWVNSKGQVLSRYQTQKQNLSKLGFIDDQGTEDSIMSSLGYFKIYNSGNQKFIWLNKNT